MRTIRRKKSITVLFIVAEASTWKSEMLYLKMLDHPRFNPILGITSSNWDPNCKKILLDYIQRKGYDYIDLDAPNNNIKKINPDIKFYYKPYDSIYRFGLYFHHHLKSILCTVNYGFNVSAGASEFTHKIKDYSWKDFVENDAVLTEMKEAGKDVANKAVTGLPIQDILALPKDAFIDLWQGNKEKKRIIYAPHHSFKGTNGSFIEYATFLEFGDFILQMAKKYSDQVQWVFKPHPSLKGKLTKEWGEDRTDAYFKTWENLPNTQVELGEYNGIFKYSDAMIHDCSSFLVEYLCVNKPVLFLEHRPYTPQQLHTSDFGFDAYMAHYHASTKSQIESFILSVINGTDPMSSKRQDYYNKYLALPHNKTACENIINTILGYE